jgi:hypothetical protein
MSRHERIAVYADHLHCEQHEIVDGNGTTVLYPIYRLGADDDGYHDARLLGAWVGEIWLNRAWFCAAEGEDHVFKMEGIVADACDRGYVPNEPAIAPKGAAK